MNGDQVALDTNEAIAVLNDSDHAGRWIAGFARVHLPVPVIGELRYGAMNSRRPTENRQRVDALVASCRALSADLATADTYAAVRMQLKKAGTPIPENDVWIAAICIQHGLALATSDEHFTHVPGLQLVERRTD